jgi:hypothetical protein
MEQSENRSELPNNTEQTLEEITYNILPPDKVTQYVINVCEKEWTENDFPLYGEDLYKSTWQLEEVSLSDINIDKSLLENEDFQKRLKPRVAKQYELLNEKKPIPPFILRGRDYLIWDGYARYHFLKELGVKKCLAYVGRREELGV